MGANTPSNETGPHELALLVDVECEFDAKTKRTLVTLRASIRNLRHVAPVTREGSTGKASMSIRPSLIYQVLILSRVYWVVKTSSLRGPT